jgi:hypothetical protein
LPVTAPDTVKVKMEAVEADELDPLWQDLDWCVKRLKSRDDEY